nr:threonine/serine exporter family protein [Nesterenkonia sandarakina]
MQAERAATGTVPILDRLAGTPFENPYQAEAHVETDELATIAFVLDLGEALFRYGAGALEVETSIIAVTAAFGMKNTDADITNQSISLNWAPDGKIPYSRVRVVRSWSNNFRALASVHQLVTDIISGRLTRGDAEDRLREITREPKPYPRWMVTICGAIFASFFAAFLGAPLLDASMGFFATILVLWTTRQLATWRVPEYFGLAAGGFMATSFAMGAFAMDMPIRPSMVVAGGLMILLPSARIVSAIQDGINGFPITAAGRLMSSMIAFAGMTSGIMAAVVIANMLGAPEIEVAVGLTRLYHPAVLVALVFLAAVAAAVVEQASWRMLLPIGAVSALGFCAYYAAEVIGLGERITPVFGAVVVGALGRVLALRMGSPQLVVAVPAMMFMLPGLMVFRGMYQIAMDASTVGMMGGLTELFNALIIIMAIAAGIVLGDVLMRPFTAGLQSHERSRTRRR